MKSITIFLVAILAIAGSAFAQQSDTSSTAAAVGTYPAGTSFNGVPLSGLELGSGAIIAWDGSTADGHLSVRLLGIPNPLTGAQQVISVEASATGGSRPALNLVTITGSCTIDMGDGTPPVPGVPIVATIATDAQSLGTVGLTLGATALPSATMNGGAMTIEDITQ